MFRAFGDPDQEQQDEEPDAADEEAEAEEESAPKPEELDEADEPPSKRARSGSIARAQERKAEDLKILALILRGCDVLEVYSPQRVG